VPGIPTAEVVEPLAAPPSGGRRIAQISSSLAGTQAATAVLGLLFWTVAARGSSLAAVGVAGAAVSAMALLSALGSFGLGTLLIARLPGTPQPDRRVLVRTALALAGSLAAALALVVPFVTILVADNDGLRAVAGTPGTAVLFAFGTALMAVALVVDQAVLVLGSGKLQLERNIVASLTKLLVLLALTAAGRDGGMDIFAAWTVGTLVSLPVVSWRTRGGRRLQRTGRLIDPRSLRGLGRAAASHHALNTTLSASLQLLPVIVLLAVSAGDNGVFSSALQFTGFVFALPYALSVGLFAAAEGDEGEVLRRMRSTLPLGLALSVLANIVMYPLAPYILSIYGEVYAEQGADVLRLLVLAGIAFVVKDHYVALRRVQDRTGHASLVLLGFTFLELGAAWLGAVAGGTVGLCLGWLAVLAVEAVVLGAVLWMEARADDSQAQSGGLDTLRRRRLVLGSARTGRTAASDGPRPVAGPLDLAPPRAPLAADAPVVHSADWLARWGSWVGVGPVLLAMTCGLLAIAQATSLAREGNAGEQAQALYLAGLVLIFLPAAVGVLLPGIRSRDRVLLALAMSVLLQLSRVVLYPTRFMFHDELLHANVLRQIQASGQLFSFNPLLPISGYYPGLEIATSGVHALTGLSLHASAVLVLVLARSTLALAVLLVVQRLTGSARAGAVACVVYACNSQMIFFNSQFSYQTLALPLSVLTVYLFLSRAPGSWTSLVTPLLALAGVALTHHVTMGLLVAALAGWCALAVVLQRDTGQDEARPLAIMTVAGAAMFTATLLNPGNTLGSYLGAIVASSSRDLLALARGEQSKALFANSAGVQNAVYEQVLVLASLAITVLVLAPALLHARRYLRARITAAVVLSLTALLYPIIPGGHLTRATAEVGDRAAGFVYVGVAFVVAAWLSSRPPLRRSFAVAGGLLATITFLGGVVLGAGPVAGQLPGPFRVSADARSVDGPNLAAAAWMRENLPDDSRVYADRVGGLLAAAYGEQFTVRHISTGVDASRLLLSPDFGRSDLEVLRAARIEYVVVDRRNAFGLPNRDVYVESGEFGEDGRTAPVPTAAVRKLDAVDGVDRLYDNGSIAVYDVRGLLDGG